jgi:hypothetical protein
MNERSVVERAYAYVEDMFGLEHADKTAHAELSPGIPITAQRPSLSSEDAMWLDPYTFQSVAELHLENRRRAGGE